MTKPWRLAIFKLREQLEGECLSHNATARRFQQRRLIHNLVTEIESAGTPVRSSMMSYWLFCGSPWQDQLGYNTARQQHYAELNACKLPPEFQPKGSDSDIVKELMLRLDSLASWIEAQESWILWRQLNRYPAAWDHNDLIARRQAIDAAVLARLPVATKNLSDSGIVQSVRSFGPWTDSQWAKILKVAARIAAKPEKSASDLDRWVWWRYPIFNRYRWTAPEVCRAARKKFGELDVLVNEAAFQSAWVRRGLRFTGTRTRQRCPHFWNFVINEEVPKDIDPAYSMLTWISYEKSPPKS
jgi:hypothetical protein